MTKDLQTQLWALAAHLADKAGSHISFRDQLDATDVDAEPDPSKRARLAAALDLARLLDAHDVRAPEGMRAQ